MKGKKKKKKTTALGLPLPDGCRLGTPPSPHLPHPVPPPTPRLERALWLFELSTKPGGRGSNIQGLAERQCVGTELGKRLFFTLLTGSSLCTPVHCFRARGNGIVSLGTWEVLGGRELKMCKN